VFPRNHADQKSGSLHNSNPLCPGCGSNDVHIHRIKRKANPTSRRVKVSQSWTDSEEDIEVKKPVQRRHHPYKYLSAVGASLKRNPAINLPRPRILEITDDMKLFAQYSACWWKLHLIPFEISPLVFEKYPEIWDDMKEDYYAHIVPAFKIVLKIMDSATDDKWDRSLTEWLEIILTASNEGYRAASRKYYGLTPNAEKIYLSTKRIKQIESDIKKLASDVVEHMPYYFAFVTFMIKTAKSDPKLYEELKRLDKKYDRLIRDDLLIKGWEEEKQKQKQELERQTNNNNMKKEGQRETNSGGSNSNSITTNHNEEENYYEYYEFRHRDNDVYKMQKLKCQQGKRKSNPDGWKTCCILKRNELPSNIRAAVLESE
jgi:hypothetical protein